MKTFLEKKQFLETHRDCSTGRIQNFEACQLSLERKKASQLSQNSVTMQHWTTYTKLTTAQPTQATNQRRVRGKLTSKEDKMSPNYIKHWIYVFDNYLAFFESCHLQRGLK